MIRIAFCSPSLSERSRNGRPRAYRALSSDFGNKLSVFDNAFRNDSSRDVARQRRDDGRFGCSPRPTFLPADHQRLRNMHHADGLHRYSLFAAIGAMHANQMDLLIRQGKRCFSCGSASGVWAKLHQDTGACCGHRSKTNPRPGPAAGNRGGP